MVWQKNGTPETLLISGKTIEIINLTGQLFNVFLTHALNSGTIIPKYIFNDDETTVYSSRFSDNGNVEGNSINDTGIRADNFAISGDFFAVAYLFSRVGDERLAIINIASRGSGLGAGISTQRDELVGKYTPTVSEILEVKMFNDTTGNYEAASNQSALGDS